MTQTTFPQTLARMDGKRGAPLGNQNASLPILNFARIGIVSPYFQIFSKFWPVFSLGG